MELIKLRAPDTPSSSSSGGSGSPNSNISNPSDPDNPNKDPNKGKWTWTQILLGVAGICIFTVSIYIWAKNGMPFFDLSKKPDGMPPPPPSSATPPPTTGPATPPSPTAPNTTPSTTTPPNPAASSSSSTSNTNPTTLETAVDIVAGTPTQIADVVGNPERRVIERVAQAAINAVTEDILEAPEAAAAPAIDEHPAIAADEVANVVEAPAVDGGAGADPVIEPPVASSDLMQQDRLEQIFHLTGSRIVNFDFRNNIIFFDNNQILVITPEILSIFANFFFTSNINYLQYSLNGTLELMTDLQRDLHEHSAAINRILENVAAQPPDVLQPEAHLQELLNQLIWVDNFTAASEIFLEIVHDAPTREEAIVQFNANIALIYEQLQDMP